MKIKIAVIITLAVILISVFIFSNKISDTIPLKWEEIGVSTHTPEVNSGTSDSAYLKENNDSAMKTVDDWEQERLIWLPTGLTALDETQKKDFAIEIGSMQDVDPDRIYPHAYIEHDFIENGEISKVIFYSGTYQDWGWVLGVYAVIEDNQYQLWFDTIDGINKVMPFRMKHRSGIITDTQSALLIVTSGNVTDSIYLLFYDEEELNVLPIMY